MECNYAKGQRYLQRMIGYYIHYIIPFCSILQIYFLPQKEVNYHLSLFLPLSLFLSPSSIFICLFIYLFGKKREKPAQTI